jgi:hypothetical protein
MAKRTHSEMSNEFTFEDPNKSSRTTTNSPSHCMDATLAQMPAEAFEEWFLQGLPSYLASRSISEALPSDLLFSHVATQVPLEFLSLNKSNRASTLTALTNTLLNDSTVSRKYVSHIARLAIIGGFERELAQMLRKVAQWEVELTARPNETSQLFALLKILAGISEPAVTKSATSRVADIFNAVKANDVPLNSTTWERLLTTVFPRDSHILLQELLQKGVFKLEIPFSFDFIPNNQCDAMGYDTRVMGKQPAQAPACLLVLSKLLMEPSTTWNSKKYVKAMGSAFLANNDQHLLRSLLSDPRIDLLANFNAATLARYLFESAFHTNNLVAFKTMLSVYDDLNLYVSDSAIYEMLGSLRGWHKHLDTFAHLAKLVAARDIRFVVDEDADGEQLETPVRVDKGQVSDLMLERFNVLSWLESLCEYRRTKANDKMVSPQLVTEVLLAFRDWLSPTNKEELVNWSIERKRNAATDCNIIKAAMYAKK